MWIYHISYNKFSFKKVYPNSEDILIYSTVYDLMKMLIDFSQPDFQNGNKTYLDYQKLFEYYKSHPTHLYAYDIFRFTFMYDNECYAEIMNCMYMTNYQLGQIINSSFSNKFEEALQNFTMLDKKLENLSLCQDSSRKIILSTLRDVIIKPIITKIKIDNINTEKSADINPTFDNSSNDEYIPCNNIPSNSGDCGSVEIYRDMKNNRNVAIKILKNKEKSFEKEKIDSPYIMKIYGITSLKNNKEGLIMEYISNPKGISTALYNTMRFSKKDVVKICLQLVQAFEAFAKAGFNHNDLFIHTNNIVIDSNKNLKIVDYDDAERIEDSPEICTKDNIKNTLQYIAIALNVSYPDLCNAFFDNHKYLTFKTASISYIPITDIKFSDNLPSFDELKQNLKELEDNL